LTIDLPRAVRRLKPEKRVDQLRVRASPPRLYADQLVAGRSAILPDTCVYIHNAAGKLPASAQALVDNAIQFHCAVCIGELAVGLGNLNPGAHNYAAVRRHYESLIGSMPTPRILVPDDDTWSTAGLMAGTLARAQNYQPAQRGELLNDALIYLTASKHGAAVLTQNADFDLLSQLRPSAAVIFY
jgi:predicted nucleic acid-binding protein